MAWSDEWSPAALLGAVATLATFVAAIAGILAIQPVAGGALVVIVVTVPTAFAMLAYERRTSEALKTHQEEQSTLKEDQSRHAEQLRREHRRTVGRLDGDLHEVENRLNALVERAAHYDQALERQNEHMEQIASKHARHEGNARSLAISELNERLSRLEASNTGEPIESPPPIMRPKPPTPELHGYKEQHRPRPPVRSGLAGSTWEKLAEVQHATQASRAEHRMESTHATITSEAPFGKVHLIHTLDGLSAQTILSLQRQQILDTDSLWNADAASLAHDIAMTAPEVRRMQIQAELLAIDGLGPRWARRLVEAGVQSIHHLAELHPRELLAMFDKHGGRVRNETADALIDKARSHIPGTPVLV